jgi:hypothetical protein
MLRLLARVCHGALDHADYFVTLARLRVLDWFAGPDRRPRRSCGGRWNGRGCAKSFRRLTSTIQRQGDTGQTYGQPAVINGVYITAAFLRADKRPDYAGAGDEAVRADRGSRSDSTSFLPPGKARGGR